MPNDFYSRKQLLTIDDVAEILNISEKTVRRLIAQRQIGFCRVMRSIRFDRKDVMDYLERTRREPIGSNKHYASKTNY